MGRKEGFSQGGEIMIINREQSVIPACDVETIQQFEKIVRETTDIDGIGGYKIGFELGLTYGLPFVVETARKYTIKPLIYDHQKAATDIPETGKNFARVIKKAGIDAVILFPQAGPVTQYEWIMAAQENGLGVIVGGEMTHPRYLHSDMSNGKKDYTKIFRDLGIDEGLAGYICEFAPEDMYELAGCAGVRDFVMPGNKPERIKLYKDILERNGFMDISIYSPGFVAQGGVISDGAKAAGKKFHAIVGTAIYTAQDMRAAALELTSQLCP